MTSLDPGTAPTRGGKRPIDPQPTSNAPGRRTVRFTVRADVAAQSNPKPSGGARPKHRSDRGRSLPTSRDDWLVLAERVVGDWAATLRAALLLVLVVAGAIMGIGLAFGLAAALASVGIALLVFLVGRRRDGGSPDR